MLLNKLKAFLYSYFRIDRHNSSIRAETLAGITNFFTVIYIVILVPEIIMEAFPGAVGSNGVIGGFHITDSLTADEMLVALTAAAFIAAGIGTILMGLIINIPFVQGPSLSIGTFITYTLCKSFGYSYNQALAIVFLSGICFFIISMLGIEKKIHKSIPLNIKYAVTSGIGLFIAFTGLQKAHIITITDNSLKLFDITNISHAYTREALLALTGIIFITVLIKKHIHGAIFIGKIVCIFMAIPLGLIKAVDAEKISTTIKFSEVMFKMDFFNLLDLSSPMELTRSVLALTLALFGICIMDIFETMGMLIATDNLMSTGGNMKVKKRIPQILEIDAASTSIGAVLGSTTVSTYLESTTGIVEGGRTGLTAVVTGLLFFASVFITPFVAIIPSAATATTLIIAGVLMMSVIKFVDFQNEAEAVPAFLTLFLMPLTGSLLVGISFGVISYVVIHIFIRETQNINKVMYLLAVLFFITLILLPK